MAWLHSFALGSITTWHELTRAFVAKFFPPSKTASLRNQITALAQRDGEIIYKEWERFKVLLCLCPHHGLQKWIIIQMFSSGITHHV